MTNLRSAIHFILSFQWDKERETKRESERKRAKYLEGRSEGAPSSEHRSRGKVICVLRSPIYDLWWGATGQVTTTTTSELRRQQRRRRRDRGLLGLVLVCVLGIFFFDKHLCVWFAGAPLCLVCWSLFCFCIGVWSLCQQRCDVMGFISLPAMWWVQFLILCIIFIFIFFLLRIHGLAVSELPVIYWAHRGLGFVVIFFFPDFS